MGFSVVVMHGFSYPKAYGILVPGPGMKPASPALEGGFLTTGPPGKPHQQLLLFFFLILAHIFISQQLLLIAVNSVKLRRSWGWGSAFSSYFILLR